MPRYEGDLTHAERKQHKYIKKVPAPGGGYYYIYPKDKYGADGSYSKQTDKAYNYTTKNVAVTNGKKGVKTVASDRSIHTDRLFGRKYKEEFVTGYKKGKATEVTKLTTREYGKVDRALMNAEHKASEAYKKGKKAASKTYKKGKKAVAKFLKRFGK